MDVYVRPLKQFDLQNHKIDLLPLMHSALGKITKGASDINRSDLCSKLSEVPAHPTLYIYVASLCLWSILPSTSIEISRHMRVMRISYFFSVRVT